MKTTFSVLLGFLLAAMTQSFARAGDGSLPADWLAGWNDPAASDRPLQIVHGIDPARVAPEGIEQMLHADGAKPAAPVGMRYYQDRGLGGVVCNVAFQDYMQSEEHWKTLIAGVEQCQRLGMVVWLYDEEGYPSGAAGKLVLAENPAFEATNLVFDASRQDPLFLRPGYEYTHASNNYHAARRCPNLIDDRATACFIEKTHAAYWKRLEPYFGRTIQAMFTDEPSLMAVNLGQLPESARKNVPVVDPVDASVKPLPAVPWSYDLAERYQERYGEDLLARRRSLFAGDSAEDRKVRRQYWALVADLIADRYFGAIGRWCAGHRVASSGHGLWEEQPMHHVPLEGNGLKILARMDIPGLDMLSSDPKVVCYGGWMTAAMPASAALLTGRRRVMTEVSDFSQKMGGQGPAGLAEMQATAAWQAAWGVTDFTLYYGLADRSADEYRAYCQYVGRLNAVLKPAQPDPEVLLYYPIHDLWAEYLPVAEPLSMQSQSPRAQRIVGSFQQIGQLLGRRQIPFAVIDHEFLATAKVRPEGTLAIGNCSARVLILPQDVELPQPAGDVVEAFRRAGGQVLSPSSLGDLMHAACRIEPPSEDIVLGRFLRDGRRVMLLVNVGTKPYVGHLTTVEKGVWQTMDPATGEIRPAATDQDARIPLELRARQAILVVEGQRKAD